MKIDVPRETVQGDPQCDAVVSKSGPIIPDWTFSPVELYVGHQLA